MIQEQTKNASLRGEQGGPSLEFAGTPHCAPFLDVNKDNFGCLTCGGIGERIPSEMPLRPCNANSFLICFPTSLEVGLGT